MAAEGASAVVKAVLAGTDGAVAAAKGSVSEAGLAGVCRDPQRLQNLAFAASALPQ